jgi:molybdopterin-containing oxidoreductase family iron-sulfur binding subunit
VLNVIIEKPLIRIPEMSNKQYWNSLDQLEKNSDFIKASEREFQQEIPVDEFLSKSDLDSAQTSRRDFLKYMGFGLGAATLAACETPVMRSIPYVFKPETVNPGVANYYASTFFNGTDFNSVLVKTREGRPIFIKPNDKYPASLRGLTARANTSVLELYDENRYRVPSKAGVNMSEADIDSEVGAALNSLKSSNGKIRILSSSVPSPSSRAAIEVFAKGFGGQEGENPSGADVKHIEYDAVSYSGMLDANAKDFGLRAIPNYKFEEAKVIVSVGADFLASWLDEVSNGIGYTSRRNPAGAWMSRHFQFESNLSLSGSNADVRGAIKPSQYSQVLGLIYNELASKSGASSLSVQALSDDDNSANEKIKTAAAELWASRGASLVLCGCNDTDCQRVCNAINQLLGNYGKTIDWSAVQYTRNGDDKALSALVEEMKSGTVGALIIIDANPVYNLPASLGFADALKNVKTSIFMGDRPNETGEACGYVCPTHHYLEAWNDYRPATGIYTLAQPVIKPLFRTRQWQSALLKWSGMDADYYNFIKANWQREFSSRMDATAFDGFWNRTLQDGVADMRAQIPPVEMAYKGTESPLKLSAGNSGAWEIQFYVKPIGDGAQANNPHLQELPDPISRISWDNYVVMNPSDMAANGWETRTAQEKPANVVSVSVNGQSFELPAVAVPGQKRGTAAIALGYGRTVVGPAGRVGANAYPALKMENGSISYAASGATISDAGKTHPIASIQTHHTMMGRKIVNETSLGTFTAVDKNDDTNGWNKDVVMSDSFGKKVAVEKLNLWPDYGIELGHRWGMSIDLNSCTGCGACVTACHLENNVPVVGRDEIRRTRSMFWLRVDRYFSSDMNQERAEAEGEGAISKYAKMEIPSEYPQVVFQPVMCQHCNHAPCETVCPVAATTHSEEGLNQMAYNRCVGTRYCANNCPYKVRRFNWFNYNDDPMFTTVNPAQSELTRMVLNPDVVVRARGVIEKCSFCVQRIQEGKLVAKKAGRPVQDGDVVSACAEACPTNAIAFGDLNDSKSAVRKRFDDSRAYKLIEEVGTQPNVTYMTKVRNVNA